MIRKIVSIVLIFFGLLSAAEAAFCFLQYSRTQEVVEKGILGHDTEEAKSLIAEASGYQSYESMVERERLYFKVASVIAILLIAFGLALWIIHPKTKNDLQFDYLYDECDHFDQKQTKRWRF